MGCNCKAKIDTDKLVKTIEDINKSKSRNYINGNKFLMKSAFKSLSVLVYVIFGILIAISIIPFSIYAIITKKTFTIRPNKIFKTL